MAAGACAATDPFGEDKTTSKSRNRDGLDGTEFHEAPQRPVHRGFLQADGA
ncbi:hypothetical protein OG577_01415 [Streptomyces canus]|nr:hypothetical protein [Streptomyces canus]